MTDDAKPKPELSPLTRAMASVLQKHARDNPDERASLNGFLDRIGVGAEAESNDSKITYVAIERARVFGGGNDSAMAEGQIFLLQADGSLKPLSGNELSDLAERYPDFVRTWRLAPDD